jgi:UDP-N-acetylmuramate dehydrogenase
MIEECKMAKTIIKSNLQNEIKGKILLNEPLSNHTSFRIGGPAEILVIPQDINDIKYIVKLAEQKQLSIHVIGNGTNLLVLDNGVKGIVIKIANTFDKIVVNGEKIVCGAGLSLSKLLNVAVEHGLSGLEFAAGIPGTVGGAVAMNAGSHNGAMSTITEKVVAVDYCGVMHQLTRDDCHFGYRESVFQEKPVIILEVEIILRKDGKKVIEEKIKRILEVRRENQPLDKPSAGCIFKNPENYAAAELIEKAGLKGKTINNAQVSLLHSNFIVNLGGAKAKDVLELIDLVKKEVAKFGVSLNPEVRVIPEKDSSQ